LIAPGRGAGAALSLGQPPRAADRLDQATRDKLTAQPKADGYDMRKIRAEDGPIEAGAPKDGSKPQLCVDAGLKMVNAKTTDD
jgi:hypothetical protein